MIFSYSILNCFSAAYFSMASFYYLICSFLASFAASCSSNASASLAYLSLSAFIFLICSIFCCSALSWLLTCWSFMDDCSFCCWTGCSTYCCTS